MSRRDAWAAIQIGCTYTGTVVGAGFASGQEVWQFFGRFGNWGYVAIPLTTLLFAWLGYRVMWLGHRLRARSYHDVNLYLFGPLVGRVMDAIWLVMLVGVCVAMTAGAGALLYERLSWTIGFGALVTVVITFFTVLWGMAGVLRANIVIVPIMVSFVLFATFDSLAHHGIRTPLLTGHLLSVGHPELAGVAAVLYAAFNLGLAAGVLIPLGAQVESVDALRWGARLGAITLGTMLTALLLTLMTHYPRALTFAVPMGFVAAQFGAALHYAFIFVLWGEIYSTLVGNVYAIDVLFAAQTRPARMGRTALLLLAALLLSRIGFVNLVHYGYQVFGWASLVLLSALLWPRSSTRT